MAAEQASPVLVLGIDFGTTYSGIAWCRAGDINEIKFITNWKKRSFAQGDKQKVPSAIFYHHLNDEDPEWGATTPQDDTVLRWFKLLLVDEKDLPDHIRHSVQLKIARALMLKANKTPVQILGDYLRQLWHHCRQNILRAEGRRMMTVSTVHLVVTLPAIWPYYVRSRMTEALGHAGLLNITKTGHTTLAFISEPEAAALTCIKENADRFNVRVGDHFVICDAGGGTVDLITYKIEKLDPLIVSESVKGDGGLCGAMFLDERFLKLLKESIPFEAQKSLDKQTFPRIMESDWESGLKASFCESSGDLPLQLSYNSPVDTDFFPSKFSIDVSKIREKVFDPVVEQVKQLVQKQVDAVKHKYKKKPKFVILVGGFGRSLYLHQHLQDAVGNRVDVLQQDGEKPWTAVLRGAVLHGLARTNHTSSIKVTVASRVSRHSYGTLVNILPFDAKEHDVKDRVWDDGQREFLAVEQTRWFVEIGSSVSTYDPVCASFWQDLTSPDQDLQIDIVTSDASTPPPRKDDSVKPMCIIKASELPKWETIPVWTNEDGQVFHRITYELRMISDGSSMEFQVFHKNKSIASGSVAFDSTSQNDTDDEDDVQMGSPQPLNNNDNGNNIIDMTDIDSDSDSDYVEAEE
ncbi:heat shock 70 kDa 12B [Fusarium subglutinans]|uniref:Heat shock 70 kDa 12B n=1 Tax=Gibberella subglutinans TaxID=42677 RepID=A0A8H5Q4H5_GIBSU|nr:heat shock 70 kDa 12B [Fusarium subglutinans]KAF5607897.1 heat shock 70 kDa 12B [Fusarium subglutinans]